MLQLPFGLRGDQLIHISDVEAGLACECVCPACGHPLIARKGSQVAHHFAHARDAACAHAVETALHLAAKRVLEAEGQLQLPGVIVTFGSYKNPWPIQEDSLIRFDDVRLERRLSDIVPDILLVAKGRLLIVEVAVTHAVDEEKLQKIRRLGISALEITLERFARNPTLDELREEVIFSTRSKQWLYNAREEAIRRMARGLAEVKRHVPRNGSIHVKRCPLQKRSGQGQSYADVREDCLYCPYCLEAGLEAGANGAVICAGQRRLDTYQDFLNARTTAQPAPAQR